MCVIGRKGLALAVCFRMGYIVKFKKIRRWKRLSVWGMYSEAPVQLGAAAAAGSSRL